MPTFATKITVIVFVSLLVACWAIMLEQEQALAQEEDGQYFLPWTASDSWVLTGIHPHSSETVNDPRRDALDFGLPHGTNVLAIKNGIIRYSHNTPYGGLVVQEMADGMCAAYLHLSALEFSGGSSNYLNIEVNRGQLIGRSGTFGAPHLHLAVFPMRDGQCQSYEAWKENGVWQGDHVNEVPIYFVELGRTVRRAADGQSDYNSSFTSKNYECLSPEWCDVEESNTFYPFAVEAKRRTRHDGVIRGGFEGIRIIDTNGVRQSWLGGDKALNRQQIAKVVYHQVLGLGDIPTCHRPSLRALYTDADQISESLCGYVLEVTKKGVMKGFSSNGNTLPEFRPNQGITKAEFLTTVVRGMQHFRHDFGHQCDELTESERNQILNEISISDVNSPHLPNIYCFWQALQANQAILMNEFGLQEPIRLGDNNGFFDTEEMVERIRSTKFFTLAQIMLRKPGEARACNDTPLTCDGPPSLTVTSAAVNQEGPIIHEFDYAVPAGDVDYRDIVVSTVLDRIDIQIVEAEPNAQEACVSLRTSADVYIDHQCGWNGILAHVKEYGIQPGEYKIRLENGQESVYYGTNLKLKVTMWPKPEVPAPEGINVALKKPVTVYERDEPQNAGWVTDGNPSTFWRPRRQLQDDIFPNPSATFVQIDLQAHHIIQDIRITVRMDDPGAGRHRLFLGYDSSSRIVWDSVPAPNGQMADWHVHQVNPNDISKSRQYRYLKLETHNDSTTPGEAKEWEGWREIEVYVLPTNSISGRVWLDQDANGRDDSELGLSGIFMELLNANEGTVVASTSTGTNGGYTFDQIPPSAGIFNYRLRINPGAGYGLTAHSIGDNERNSDFDPKNNLSGMFTLGMTTRLVNYDAGLVNHPDADMDQDGLLNRFEGAPTCNQNSDNDETTDCFDTDDDNDGILTIAENADPNNDGNPIDCINTDGADACDYLDTDDDNDSIPTNIDKCPYQLVSNDEQIDNTGCIVEELYELGEVSCDSQVDVIDAMYVLQYDVGLRSAATQCPLAPDTLLVDACDVNSDNACNSIDALFVMQCNAGLSNVFCPAFVAANVISEDYSSATGRATLYTDPVITDADGLLHLPIKAILTAGTLGAATIEMRYDPAQWEVIACEADPAAVFDLALCNSAYDSDGSDMDSLRLSVLSTTGVTDEMLLGNIVLRPLSAISNVTIEISTPVFSDATGLSLDVIMPQNIDDSTLTEKYFLPIVQR